MTESQHKLQVPIGFARQGKYLECVEYLLTPDGESLKSEFNSIGHDAWYMAGDCWYRLSMFEKSVDAFLCAHDELPGDRDTILALGNCFSQLAEYEKAIFCFGFACLVDENDSEARYNLGNAYLDASQAALAECQFQLISNPADPLYERARKNLQLSRDRQKSG